MSKTIKIPEHMRPYEVIVNGVKYCYPAGEEVTVPDEVAEVIQRDIDAHKTPDPALVPTYVKTVNGVAPDGNGNANIPAHAKLVKIYKTSLPAVREIYQSEEIGWETIELEGPIMIAEYEGIIDGEEFKIEFLSGVQFFARVSDPDGKTYIGLVEYNAEESLIFFPNRYVVQDGRIVVSEDDYDEEGNLIGIIKKRCLLVEREPEVITFTIDGVKYAAKPGMTWEEWANSNYSMGNYRAYDDGESGYAVRGRDGSFPGFEPTDVIAGDRDYTT